MCVKPREIMLGGASIGQQRERAGGDEERAEPSGQIQGLHGLGMHGAVSPRCLALRRQIRSMACHTRDGVEE